jgi:hypothetical protein
MEPSSVTEVSQFEAMYRVFCREYNLNDNDPESRERFNREWPRWVKGE